MLDKKTISLPFSLGIDQKTSDGTAKPGALESTSNSWFDKSGNINKRKGFSEISNARGYDPVNGPTTGNISSGRNCYAYNEDLLVADENNLYRRTADGKFQDVGKISPYTYSREKVAVSEDRKVGCVKMERVQVSGRYYDVMVWAQAEPVKFPVYEFMFAVRDVDTGSFIRRPYTFQTVATDAADDFATNLSKAPCIRLLKISDSVLFVVFTFGNFIKYFKVPDFINNTSAAVIPGSIDFLYDGGSPASQILHHVYFTDFDIAHYEESSTDYIILLYTSAAGYHNVIKYQVSGGSLNHSAESELYLDPSTTSRIPLINNGVFLLGQSFLPGIHLRVNSSGDYSAMVNSSGTAIDANLRATPYIQHFNPSTLAQSNPALTNSALYNRVLMNGFGYESGSNEAHMVTLAYAGSKNLGGTTFEPHESSFPSGFYDSGTATYSGLKTQTVEIQHSGAVAGEGYAYIYPPGSNGTPAYVWANVTSGSTTSHLHLTVIEPGSGFRTIVIGDQHTLFSTDRNSVRDWINNQVSSITFDWKSSPDPVLALNPQEDDRGLLTSVTRILIKPGGTPYISDINDLYQNASVVSDIANNVFAVAKTNYNYGSFNTFEFMSNEYGVTYANAPTSDCSSTVISEHKSKVNQQLKLLSGVSNATFFNVANPSEQSVVYASNSLVNEFIGSKVAGDNSPSQKYIEQTFCPVICTMRKTQSYERSLPGANAGSTLLIGGGTLFSYDGQKLVENGFYEAPSFRSVQAARVDAVTSKLESPKTYFYAAVFEYTDAKGNLHESVPSDVVEVATTVDGSGSELSAVHVRINVCDANRKRNYTRVAVYRTAPDGALLKKIAVIPFNNGDRFVDFMDLGEDDDVFTNAPAIYTAGGVLPNFQPGSVTDICTHRGRVVVATPSEFVRFSKVEQQGFCYSFPAPNFVIDLPADSRLVSGVESNPNFLVLFTESDVYAIQGDGPDNFGVGSFGKPQLIGKGQGAVKYSAHLAHAIGTFYQSHRGIYLIAPNGQINYIGANVQDSVGENLIQSMDLFDHVNEVRMLIYATNGTIGTVIVYNTLYQQWSQWGVNLTGAFKALANQCFYLPPGGNPEEAHIILERSGTILRQSDTAYTDAGGDYDLSVKLRPIQAAGLQQAQRVYRAMLLYDYVTDSTLNMKFARDYLSSVETHTISVGAVTGIEQIRAHLANQKCKAIQAEIIVTSSGEGLILKGIAFQIGARAGTFKLPASQTA